MIVTLTTVGTRLMDNCTTPAVHEALSRDRTVAGTRVTITGPYTAWMLAKQAIMDTWLSPTLGRRADTPARVFTALRAISRAENQFIRHPAMRKQALIGRHTGWFPVWEHPTPINGVFYSPHPVPGGRFVVLGAECQDQHRTTPITVWTETGFAPRHHWLASEDAHTRLLTEHS